MNTNIPNLLTLFRILLIPFMVLFFYIPSDWARIVTAIIFAAAAFTDWLDGYLARILNQTSAFGAFLDPVADKLMVGVALVLLVQDEPTALLTIPTIIIISREIAISALREWMSTVGDSIHVAVSWMGKVKTSAQMLAIWLLLLHFPIAGLPVKQAGYVLLYLAAALTVWSMFLYLKAAWPSLTSEKHE